jgi:hypothetical protein
VLKGLTWREIAMLYRNSDLIVDGFSGWFGYAALEGLSCGKPVLNYLEPRAMNRMYPAGHLFLQARNTREVADILLLHQDPAIRERVGGYSRKWILEHHLYSATTAKCRKMLSELTADIIDPPVTSC